jgi:hypothetical protein
MYSFDIDCLFINTCLTLILLSLLGVCSYDSNGSVIPNEGFEFTISVRGSVPMDTTLIKAEDVVHTAVVEVVEAILDGRIL